MRSSFTVSIRHCRLDFVMYFSVMIYAHRVCKSFQLNVHMLLGAVGRPGLQGFPGHNIQGSKGITYFLLFSHFSTL